MIKSKKSKKSKQPIQAEQIFNHALKFASADVFLRSNLGDDHRLAVTMVHPSMVLAAFCIELLIKCLLTMSNVSFQPTHHLGSLFRKLPHKDKRRIEEIWNAGPRKKIGLWCKQFNKPDDLPNAINACATAFEDLRYVYEDPEKVLFYISELPQVMIDYIVEFKPDWRPTLLHPPTQPKVQTR